jgi:Ca-activated chloride channel homolog
LKRVFESINEMEKTQIERRIIVRTDDFFQYFLMAAAGFCVLYVLWKVTGARMAPLTA